MSSRKEPVQGWAPGRHGASDYPKALRVRADVVIIGAGAGGIATAAALAERGVKVALLEEGRHWRPSEFHQDVPYAFKHMYRDRGARSMRGNTVTPLPGGRGVGGSTLINSAICFRCPDSVLSSWRDDHGVVSVDPARMARLQDRVWETLGVTTQSLDVQRLNNIVFKRGAEKLGMKGSFLARSAPGCIGCGVCQLGCPTGGKASVDRTFLVEALATGNVGVYADCRVEGAVASGGRVQRITGTILDRETQQAIGTVEVEADHVVVSAGPVQTPYFLLDNGLADSTHCGQHLVVHPTVPGLAKFPFEIRPWHGVTQGYYVDCYDEGFLLQTYTVTPDQYFALLPTAVGEQTMQMMKDLKYLGSAGTLVHDEDSEGRIQVTPIGPDIQYHLGEGDKRRLIEGLRRVGEVFFAAGATQFMAGLNGAPILERPQDIAAALPYDVEPHHLYTYASHPMGTARMSGREADGVVDPWGRVWGWDNLYVSDASLFPTSLGVNPQVTVMALGLMVGETIAEGRPA